MSGSVEAQETSQDLSTERKKVVADMAPLVGRVREAELHAAAKVLGIRQVFCIPLRLVRYVDRPDAQAQPKRIGVLYLDSREKSALVSASGRAALETLATEAAVYKFKAIGGVE
jgi:LmbE family N-acetylglucosaminyl deacetylase